MDKTLALVFLAVFAAASLYGMRRNSGKSAIPIRRVPADATRKP